MKYLFLALLLGFCGSAKAQEIFSYAAFMQTVAQQHPLAQSARLAADRAAAELQKSKGAGFDPQLNAGWDTKQFSQTQYYGLFAAYVQVPTWYGVEVEGGYLLNQGYYLNPENKTPTSGHAYLGVKIPLLQGLITNERRTAVEQARLLQSASTQQIRSSLNELLYLSAQAYWRWAAAYQEVQLWQNSILLAQQRLEATRISFQQGDKPAIDTLESFSNLLDREMRLNQAQLALLQAQLEINNYLWSPQQTPLELPASAQPDPLPLQPAYDSTQLQSAMQSIMTQQPDIQLYQIQLRHLQLERRQKRNKILPKLDFKYNFLAYEHVNFFGTGADAFVENYKMGLKFTMPLFLRQSRADLQLTELKIRETDYKIQQKQLETQNKIRAYYAEINTYAQQLALIQRNVQNYQALLAAEQEKFKIGESSVFLLNSRESKLIEAQQKLIETQSKLAKAQASFIWATTNYP